MVLLHLKWLTKSTLYTCIILGILHHTDGKPTTNTEVREQSQEPVLSRRSYPSVSRRLLASRTDDNLWSASARLPTSAESGGNDHSRYKIRRDGSLSLALQHSNLRTNAPFSTNQYSSNLPSSLTNAMYTNPNVNTFGNTNTRIREAPTELRSFSVVLSDVDVVGNYEKKTPKFPNYNDHRNHEQPYEDSYAEAGVSGYHLHSNSIHRMNASWKLNPSNSSPTSQELLEFLSLFSTDQPIHSSGNEDSNNNYPSYAYGLNEVQRTTTISTDNDKISNSINNHSSSQKENSVISSSWSSANVNNESNANANANFVTSTTATPLPLPHDVHLIPFSTWSESSRSLKTEEKGQVDQQKNSNITSASSEAQVGSVQHADDNNSNINTTRTSTAKEVNANISTHTHRHLEKIQNQSYSQSTPEEDNGMLPQIVLHDLISTLGKLSSENPENGTQAQSPTIPSTLNSNSNTNRSRNTSSTDTEDASRMKPTDPNQTATDLKKLMSLLIAAQGPSTNSRNPFKGSTGEGQTSENGASVVNIVITPNMNRSNSNHTSSASPQKEKQKIVFLKNPQVKQLLDTALADPTISLAAQKIASALYAPSSIPQHNYRYPSDIPTKTSNFNVNSDVYQNENKNYFSINETKDAAATTPDGFPLTASGFLNLHHPNLQFHQALHHLVANGSSPTRINATTKTNVINIFVLNFNRDSEHKTAIEIKKQQIKDNYENNYNKDIQGEKLEQLKQKQQSISQLQNTAMTGEATTVVATTVGTPSQQSKLPLKSPFANINPFLIEKVQQSPSVSFSQMGAATTQIEYPDDNASSNNHNKNGSWIAVDTHSSSSNSNINSGTNLSFHEAMLIKPEEESQTPPTSTTEKTDRINILDLLPGDFATFTKVTEFGTPIKELNESMDKEGDGVPLVHDNLDDGKKDKIITFPYLPQRHDLQSHLLSKHPSHLQRPEGYNGYGHGSGNRDPEDLIALITSLGTSNSHSTPMSTADSGSISDGKMPTSKTTEIPLPPELSHLSWIFNNEPPPKPLPLIKGNSKETNSDLPDYDDPDFPEESIPAGDAAIIHPDESDPSLETTYDEYDITTERALSANSPTDRDVEHEGEETSTVRSKKPPKKIAFVPLRNHQNPKDPYLEHIGTSVTTVKTNVDSISPTNPQDNHGNKNQSPVGGSSPPIASPAAVITNYNGGNDLRSRVRKLITALGYSALPTLAAGAAATWSYWVPLVATASVGRKRRSMTMTQPQRQHQYYASHENLNLNHNDSFIIKKGNSVATPMNTYKEFSSYLPRLTSDPSPAPKLEHQAFKISSAPPPDHAHQAIMLMVRKPKFSHMEGTSTNSSLLSPVISIANEGNRDGRTKINSNIFNSTEGSYDSINIHENSNVEEALQGVENPPDKNDSRESLSKWIKVEVITESLPTSTQPTFSSISTSTLTSMSTLIPESLQEKKATGADREDKNNFVNTVVSSTNRLPLTPTFNNNGTIINTDDIETTTIFSRTVVIDESHQNHTVTVPQISHSLPQSKNNDSSDNKDPRRWINGQSSLPSSAQDVPLLKNFLKNVLSNEWNISTTASSSNIGATSETPLKYQNQVQLLPVPLSPVTTIEIDGDDSLKNKNVHNSSTIFLPLPENSYAHQNMNKNQYQHQLDNAQVNTSATALAYTMVLPPSKFETFKPSGQTVSIIIGQKPTRTKPNPTITTGYTNNIAIQKETMTTAMSGEPQKTISIPYSKNANTNKINAPRPISTAIAAEEAIRRKKQLSSIVDAEASYTSAALFPIWFPILFGSRKVSQLKPSTADTHRAQN